ncbi:hypothetical protein CARUB_v10007348mg, partial [Capsella rubella]
SNRLKPLWKNLYIPVGFSSSFFTFFLPFYLCYCNIMSDYVRKSLQNLDLGINDEPVPLPSVLCGNAANANRFSLIVSVVNPKKQNLRAIVNQMPKIWGFMNECRGRILGNGKVLFIFKTEESMNLVLRRGPWAFNEWMLSVHRWYPNIGEEEMKIIPFWIQIKGIPIVYLTIAMVKYIGDNLGPVVSVDFDENVNWVEFVRVCVNWSIDTPLRFQRNFQFTADENTVLKFRFERLRNFCSRCGSLKHDAKECELVFEDQPLDDDDNGEPEDNPNAGNDDAVEDEFNPGDEPAGPDFAMEGPADNHDVHGADYDTVSLETVDPVDLIPGLRLVHNSRRHQEFIITESDDSSIPSAFEDTELTAERLRFLHTKFAKEQHLEDHTWTDSTTKVCFSPASASTCKKRKSMEFLYQRREEEEDMAVLSHIHKKEKTESMGSSSGPAMHGGAGGPVLPLFPP